MTGGPSGREAARRLAVYGPNQVRRREKRSLSRLLSAQLLRGLIYLPPLRDLFGTAALPWDVLAIIATFAVIVWAADELRRRRRITRPVRASAKDAQGAS
ncbi:cation transporting ATPase C-terminal domain-containing protein [Actinomadura sp. 3N508]|uniref:cation transporting ATPase C-terminal domain-containing protein n=1 Tax=Actinomadura sp. 3N508 TaxID=3375153 RepID=UPI0037B9DF25